MKRNIHFLLSGWLLLSLLVGSAGTVAGQTAISDDQIRDILRDRVDVARKSVGIVVGLIDEKGTRVISYGKPIKTSSEPLNGDSVFEIGSVTKVFTATLLADMVERGEVRLEDPISKYLPANVKVPSRNGKEITLLDLSTQTSGLPRLPGNFAPKDSQNPYADYSVDQLYQFLSGYTLTRDIGSKYEYSNLGVGLLGHVLARRAGKDYETLVVSRVLEPLKMTSTRITLTPDMKLRLATGHNPALLPVPNWDLPTLAGAGALRSTVNDLLKFIGANLGLSKTRLMKAMEMAHQSRHVTGIPDLEIGLNWHLLKKFDSVIVWHNGGTGGYHSFIGFDPRQRRGVVVLSNSANDIDDIGRHLLVSQYPLAKYEPPKEHKEIQLDDKVLESYVGEYEVAPGFGLTVTTEAGHLFAQATGQRKFEIFPETERDFFLKVVDAQITFVKNEKGEVTHLVLHQGGRDQPAKKVK